MCICLHKTNNVDDGMNTFFLLLLPRVHLQNLEHGRAGGTPPLLCDACV